MLERQILQPEPQGPTSPPPYYEVFEEEYNAKNNNEYLLHLRSKKDSARESLNKIYFKGCDPSAAIEEDPEYKSQSIEIVLYGGCGSVFGLCVGVPVGFCVSGLPGILVAICSVTLPIGSVLPLECLLAKSTADRLREPLLSELEEIEEKIQENNEERWLPVFSMFKGNPRADIQVAKLIGEYAGFEPIQAKK